MGLFGSAISAAAQLEATEETNKTNLQIAQGVNKTNRDLAKQENEFNERMWNMANAYNDPSAQAQRLRGAGLSAAAAAQSVAGAPASAIQSANLANQQMGNSMVSPDLSGLSGMNIIGAAREVAETLKEFEQAKKTKSENKTQEITNMFLPTKLMTENDLLNWQRNFQIQNFAFNLKEFPYKLETAKYQAKEGKFKAKGQQIANQIMKQNLALGWQNFGFLAKSNELTLQKMEKEIQQTIAETQKTIADTKVSEAQVENIQANTALTNEQTKTQKHETSIKRIESILTHFGTPQQTSQKIGALVASGELKPEEIPAFFKATRTYLTSGGQIFSGDYKMRNYFQYIINEGEGQAQKTPVWSHGTLNQSIDIFQQFRNRLLGIQ